MCPQTGCVTNCSGFSFDVPFWLTSLVRAVATDRWRPAGRHGAECPQFMLLSCRDSWKRFMRTVKSK